MDKVVHFEIPADDVERANKFYSETFGWKMNSVPEMEYTIATTGPTGEDRMPSENGFINGGLMKRGDVAKSPTITISVDDIDASLELIEKNGGKVMMKKNKVGDMGFLAYFKDTEGNVTGLWQNLEKD